MTNTVSYSKSVNDIPPHGRIKRHVPLTPLHESGDVTLQEAIRIVRSIAHQTGTETIPVDDADGRILSSSICATADLPGFDRSTRDGYAVIAEDITPASPDNPVILSLFGMVEKGLVDPGSISHGQAVSVRTGGRIPHGANAVIQTEECLVACSLVRILRPAAAEMNIIRRDEDFSAHEEIYPEGWVIRPQDVAVLASLGKTRVKVRKKPVIGIISTGRELVPSESVPKSGEVREVNSYLISLFCRRQGAIPVRYGIVRDDAAELSDLLEQASRECDAIIVSGGSARDEHDITAQVIRKLGKVYTDGITFAPDKRTSIGTIGTVLVIGLPGHPSATFMVLTLVVIHLIQAMKGAPCQPVYRRDVILTVHLIASRDRDRYIRVRISDEYATPVFGKSGVIHMLSESDGIVRIPAGSEGYCKGDRVEVMTW